MLHTLGIFVVLSLVIVFGALAQQPPFPPPPPPFLLPPPCSSSVAQQYVSSAVSFYNRATDLNANLNADQIKDLAQQVTADVELFKACEVLEVQFEPRCPQPPEFYAEAAARFRQAATTAYAFNHFETGAVATARALAAAKLAQTCVDVAFSPPPPPPPSPH